MREMISNELPGNFSSEVTPDRQGQSPLAGHPCRGRGPPGVEDSTSFALTIRKGSGGGRRWAEAPGPLDRKRGVWEGHLLSCHHTWWPLTAPGMTNEQAMLSRGVAGI